MAYRASGTPRKRGNTRRVIVIPACGLLFGIYVGFFLARSGYLGIFNDNEIGNHDPILNCKASNRPRGTESLPCHIIAAESDLYLRRRWGDPARDLPKKPSKYLVTFTVGVNQKPLVNLAVAKFPKEWTIMLFHYDGSTDDWNEFEWSKTAIHVTVRKQTKWWYAKRFLHPDIVAPFDYIFIWDEDLGVEHFNAEKYIELVRKHGLEISQPALDQDSSWQMTKRRGSGEVHKITQEKPGWCGDPYLPPCAAFVEIMAPVFSNKAWRCVWHMIQNDLVHGWGLDFSLRRCATEQLAHEMIGVVDTQWIQHLGVPSLGEQGTAVDGRKAVRDRSHNEWRLFTKRIEEADKAVEESAEIM